MILRKKVYLYGIGQMFFFCQLQQGVLSGAFTCQDELDLICVPGTGHSFYQYILPFLNGETSNHEHHKFSLQSFGFGGFAVYKIRVNAVGNHMEL
mgnify:CR=1 FL=1